MLFLAIVGTKFLHWQRVMSSVTYIHASACLKFGHLFCPSRWPAALDAVVPGVVDEAADADPKHQQHKKCTVYVCSDDNNVL